MRILALSLSSLLFAHVASAQGPGSLELHHAVSPPSPRFVASVGASRAASEGSFLRTGPGDGGRAIGHGVVASNAGWLGIPTTLELASQLSANLFAPSEANGPGTRTESTASVSFRHSTGNAYLAIRAPTGDSQTPVQLLAAFGLSDFSFRVSSWRRVGTGPSVHGGGFSVVRNLNLLPTGANIGLGLSATMYRLGSRFDPIYRKRPFSIHVLVRVRFDARADRTATW